MRREREREKSKCQVKQFILNWILWVNKSFLLREMFKFFLEFFFYLPLASLVHGDIPSFHSHSTSCTCQHPQQTCMLKRNERGGPGTTQIHREFYMCKIQEERVAVVQSNVRFFSSFEIKEDWKWHPYNLSIVGGEEEECWMCTRTFQQRFNSPWTKRIFFLIQFSFQLVR